MKPLVKIWNFWHGSFKNGKKFFKAANFFSKDVHLLGQCVVDRRDLITCDQAIKKKKIT